MGGKGPLKKNFYRQRAGCTGIHSHNYRWCLSCLIGQLKLNRTFTITEAYNTYVTSPKTTILQEYIITTPFQETSTQWKQITLTQPTPTMLTIPTTVYQKTTIENARGIAFSLWIIGILIFIGGLLIQAKARAVNR